MPKCLGFEWLLHVGSMYLILTFLFQLKALQDIEENDPDAEPWSDPVEWAKAMVSTLLLLGQGFIFYMHK